MKYLKAISSMSITGILIYILHNGIGPLPALGKLLNPFTGFWTNSELAILPKSSKALHIQGAQNQIIIKYDINGVPHIFAQNDHDLYLAQGYVTAADRLWQMEFQTHFAAGRISEIVGERGLESDRYQRRMGAVYGAENSLAGMMEDPASKVALESYSAGVNAYIAQLTDSSLPFEYKLLGYKPEPWSPIKSALFLKNMSFVLASGSDELMMSNSARLHSKAIMDNLFPNYPALESPIIPENTPLDFSPLPIPKATEPYLGNSNTMTPHEHDNSLGSNNWAVSGTKTATGMPILANDPHLQLNLPSIWYQVQLHAPGVNVYGSTMPGTPNVITGFNQNIAWGVTNVGADIMDWYEVKFKDASKNEYWHNNQWKKVTRRIETIKIKGLPETKDTVLYTHHGPVVYMNKQKPFRNNIPVGHALRWIAHDKSSELTTFYKLNRAKNYDDYVAALQYFSAPAQNFVFASNQNDIALWVNGRFPLKAPQQGKYILDGSNPSADWPGFVPAAHNPHVKNPSRGFVSSANQSSVSPKQYPYYINWAFADTERGRRINQKLGNMTNINIDSMRMLQNDNYNLRAYTILPKMLEQIPNPSPKLAPAIAALKSWDMNNSVGQIAPTIFEEWIKALHRDIWADNFPSTDAQPLKSPSADRTIQLILHEPNSPWLDNQTTKNKTETLADLAASSLSAAIDTISVHRGPQGPTWAWDNWKATSIKHLLGGNNSVFDKFSHLNVKIGGGKGIVNATSERNGPSWRMVVQLNASGKPTAYGIYPGGQSGNPGSKLYDNMIPTWASGQLQELLYLSSSTEASNGISHTLILQ
jgi:penicillin G amidase